MSGNLSDSDYIAALNRDLMMERARAEAAEAEVIRLREVAPDESLTDEANALIVEELLRGSPLERALATALHGLEHYANESSWINDREYRVFPGYHARAVALVAIERARAERDGERGGGDATIDTVE